jgi:predicted RNA-binding Zn-ribbon protein involved in translation (DUF1610 family)
MNDAGFLYVAVLLLTLAVVWLATEHIHLKEKFRQHIIRYTNTRNLLSQHINSEKAGTKTVVKRCRLCQGIMHPTGQHKEWECEECGNQEVSGYELPVQEKRL